MRWLWISVFFLASFSLSAQFKNIKLAAEVDGQSLAMDPTISINSKDPKSMVAGIGPNRAVFTQDGGNTWSEVILTSPLGEAGEPSLTSDLKGNFYYVHLSDPGNGGPKTDGWLDQIVCQKSDDGGKTWSPGTSLGINPSKDQRYAWPTVHPKRAIVYVTWTQFDTYGLADANCQSNVLFSMSMNAGNKWTKPIQISQTPGDCMDDDNTAQGAFPAVAMDGRIYAVWSNQGIIFFDRSYDGGEMWLTNDIGITKQHAGSSMKIPGYKRIGSKPVLIIDNSDVRSHGSLYVVYADQVNGESDTDILLIRSTNRGDSWIKPIRINADSSAKHQFMPWMAVDQVTGHIYIVYYDRRAYDDLQTDVYMAYSFDRGNNFKEIKISETPFVPSETNSLNGYINIAAHDGIITPIWTRVDAGKASIWTTIIREDSLGKK